MDIWEYKKSSEYNKTFTDRFKKKWKYYSVKKMKKVKLNVDIIGDIDSKQLGRVKQYLAKGDDILKVIPYKKRNPFCYKVKGFMACRMEDKNGMVRIIEDILIRNIILILLCIGIMFMGCIWWINKDKGPTFDDDAVAYKMPNDQEVNTDDKKIAIPTYGELIMSAKTRDLYAAMVNPKGNKCYFKYRIILKDGNKLIYESELIKPGTAVTRLKLNQSIERGSYEIKIVVLTYDLDNYKKQLNGGVVETLLVAK